MQYITEEIEERGADDKQDPGHRDRQYDIRMQVDVMDIEKNRRRERTCRIGWRGPLRQPDLSRGRNKIIWTVPAVGAVHTTYQNETAWIDRVRKRPSGWI
jgi:hypothetical protein